MRSFHVTPSVAIFVAGTLWLATSGVGTGILQLDLSGRPELVVIGSVLIWAATWLAAAPLLGWTKPLPTIVVVAICVTPPLLTLLTQPWLLVLDPDENGMWWIAAAEPLVATIAIRWGWAAGVAVGGVDVALSLAIRCLEAPWTPADVVSWIYSVMSLVIWPIGAAIFHRLLGTQASQDARLEHARQAADRRRAHQAAALDDLPRRLLTQVGPTLEELAGGGEVAPDLADRCRRLERAVRDEVRTRRLLDDEGRDKLRRLIDRGWEVSMADEGPVLLDDADLAVARQVSRTVLSLCLVQPAGSLTLRLLARNSRLVTVVVSGPAASPVAGRLAAAAASVELDEDEVLVEIAMVSVASRARVIDLRETPVTVDLRDRTAAAREAGG